MDKLKPCPFCGGEARLLDAAYPRQVMCAKCGARTTGQGYAEDGEQDAIEKWSARHEEPARLLVAEDWDDNPNVDGMGDIPVWVEWRDAEGVGIDGWTVASQEEFFDNISDREFECRYWTKCPTDEQMEETPWQ